MKVARIYLRVSTDEQDLARKAIFEFDKLIRSIYTLRYLRDPQLQRNVHRSQNRIEEYHQLRSVIAQVSGRKELIGRTDLDAAISNQCGRLVANVIIAYNSILLSGPLKRFQAEGNQKALDLSNESHPLHGSTFIFWGITRFATGRTRSIWRPHWPVLTFSNLLILQRSKNFAVLGLEPL